MSGVWLLTLRYLAVSLISVGGNVALARMLGTRLWGILAIAQFVFAIAPELLGRGVATYLVQTAHEPTLLDIGVTFVLQQFVGLVIGVSAIVLAYPISLWYGYDELRWLLVGAAGGAFFFACRAVPVALLERSFDYGRVGIIEVSEVLVFYGISVAGALLGFPVMALAGAMLFRGGVSACLALWMSPLRLKVNELWRWEIARRVWGFGGPFVGATAVNLGISAAPVVLLGKLVNAQSLGLVNMAFLILNYLTFVVTPLSRVMFSACSRLQKDESSFIRATNDAIAFICFLFIPILAGVCATSPWWVPWVLGEGWSALSDILLAAAPAYAFWLVSSQLNSALYAEGKSTRAMAYSAALGVGYWGMSSIAIFWIPNLALPLSFTLAHLFLYFPLISIYAISRWRQLALAKAVAGLMIGIVAACLIRSLVQKQAWMIAILAFAVFGIAWLFLFKSQWMKMHVAIRSLVIIPRR